MSKTKYQPKSVILEPETNRETISTCGRSRSSTWANGSPRNTTKGMKMKVIHRGTGSKRTSQTVYTQPE